MKVKNLNSHVEHILNGYQQQLTCYRKLLEFAVQMQSLSGENEIDLARQVISQRAEVIETIRDIENSIGGHKEAVIAILHLKEFNLDKVQDLIHPGLREELFRCRDEMKETIQAIIDIDRKNEEKMANQLKDMASELKTFQQHHEIQQAYFDRPERFPEPVFFDKKK